MARRGGSDGQADGTVARTEGLRASSRHSGLLLAIAPESNRQSVGWVSRKRNPSIPFHDDDRFREELNPSCTPLRQIERHNGAHLAEIVERLDRLPAERGVI